ncbi:hypothetical protein LOTGIDRAFT_235706 [Lottia gigantea]|uniref:TPM domain-containing protein n=1 Tax=Lottia gigantea TaxID=225164 RepID=V3ZN31_LOTGI|nr:hypothetical protein LOTGIDRAFT_235706 [Lottia gigantea]ESO85732.1 hypothetical protein LOTGIDRAFT_235706 [Lottia gigantea]
MSLTTSGPNRNLKEAHMYSYLLTQKWKFEGSCNETILILYSLEDNVVYTLTMQHARLKLRDENIVQVSMDTNHYFNSKDTVGDGLKAMILGFKSFLKGEEYRPYQVEDVDGDNSSSFNSLSLFVLFISLLVALL